MSPAPAPGPDGLVRWPAPRRAPGQPRSAAALLDAGLEAHPDREALVGRHHRYTWSELDVEVARATAVLRDLGVGPGDRVAAALPNQTDIVVAFLAAMRLGAIWVGLNERLAPPELAWMLADCGARVLVTTPGVAAALGERGAELPELVDLVVADPATGGGTWPDLVAAAEPDDRAGSEPDPDAPAAIAYTSGTTGRPKGAVHSQHNICLPAAVWRTVEPGPEHQRQGVVLNLSILNMMILAPVWSLQRGWTCVAVDRTDPTGLAEWIRRERITRFTAVPAMMFDLLTHPEVTPDDLASVERVEVGGSAIPESYVELHLSRFGEPPLTGYGLTEVPTAAVRERLGYPRVPGASGVAFPHLTVTVRSTGPDDAELAPGEVGELCIGPRDEGEWAGVYTPMLGYWRRPEATAVALRDGRLRTGDLGFVDRDGNVFVKDRMNDVIIRGGANVYPAEVERVLGSVDGVHAAAVVGVADDRLGERVVAAVQPEPGAALEPEHLQQACRAELARYKVPDTILLVDGFPRNAMGKIVKTEVRTWFGGDESTALGR